jgi:hypothetical protein
MRARALVRRGRATHLRQVRQCAIRPAGRRPWWWCAAAPRGAGGGGEEGDVADASSLGPTRFRRAAPTDLSAPPARADLFLYLPLPVSEVRPTPSLPAGHHNSPPPLRRTLCCHLKLSLSPQKFPLPPSLLRSQDVEGAPAAWVHSTTPPPRRQVAHPFLPPPYISISQAGAPGEVKIIVRESPPQNDDTPPNDRSHAPIPLVPSPQSVPSEARSARRPPWRLRSALSVS